VPAKRSKTPLLDALPADAIEGLVARVRIERAVLRKRAFSQALSARGEATLREALAQHNLDAGKRFFRVPLVDQVTRALEQQPAIPVSGLKKCLLGLEATSELKEVVRDLLRDKRARVVLQGGKPTLVQFTAPVVTPQAMLQVLEVGEALVRLLRAGKAGAKKSPPLGVLVSDAQALTKTLEAALGGLFSDSTLLARLAQLTSPQHPIVFVPTLIAALGADISADTVGRVLLDAHQAGLVELRPDSGLQLLTPAQASLCPKGPTGAPLSYVRLISSPRSSSA
jgi:hypothetical protein